MMPKLERLNGDHLRIRALKSTHGTEFGIRSNPYTSGQETD